MKSASLLIVLIGSIAFASPSFAEMKNFSAKLTGPGEVPANNSTGLGTADVSYDAATQTLTWKITFDGLSGQASAAHFHGPAGEGQNAPPMVKIQTLASPMEGTANLNKEQEQALNDGKLYVNIHTAQFPDGEIRGQVMPN